ncbi:ComF family protein [Thermodesulfatator atlanticus]
MPVPLHSLRLQERGFNQSLLLARKVFQNHRVEELLLRQKYTKPQVSLKGKERGQNVKGAFGVRHPERVRGQKVLLFDDVLTTGATVTECAKTLVKNGALEVKVAVLVRAG